ncbi:lincosamide nucleotidyltransferase A/C/D/E [Microlunatus capsulatus]|uniref:Lincosamide nucleotidyltransferase A/C/D/E n=1 Tax=Microlunatus capsulatus TaxID=99117 RepID=A0ABS4ZCZ2_9ACTN|nr:lincosamide nucleotidyltransferase A/C/D/E [Microlunatus capsulatus]
MDGASVAAVLLTDVLAVTGAIDAVGVRWWVGGGWGVDVLVGRVTRAHRDLDLAVDAQGLGPAVTALAALGYRPETDWLPVRLELAAPGARWVDLHPVVLDAAGDGVQAGPDGTTFAYPARDLVSGVLEGHRLACLSVARQRVFRTGYPPRPQDRHDLALLDTLDGVDAVDGLEGADARPHPARPDRPTHDDD